MKSTFASLLIICSLVSHVLYVSSAGKARPTYAEMMAAKEKLKTAKLKTGKQAGGGGDIRTLSGIRKLYGKELKDLISKYFKIVTKLMPLAGYMTADEAKEIIDFENEVADLLISVIDYYDTQESTLKRLQKIVFDMEIILTNAKAAKALAEGEGESGSEEGSGEGSEQEQQENEPSFETLLENE
ncbi:MAG TPA: hypothetical protein VEK38_03355 [Candidatus Bathyarchaeia archaeon]|nr:hypothetical protein [Candidatus Bathyarchaeia archaeon]